jgi:hypothetical protein
MPVKASAERSECTAQSFDIAIFSACIALQALLVSGPRGAAAMGACLGGQAASPADEAAAKRSKELDAKAAADFRKDQVSSCMYQQLHSL